MDAKPLDDVMLAMDVVDTLRRNDRLVLRELSSDDQDAALLARLHEIYTAQGIAVPDHILREGVQALREDRFTYVPTPRTLRRKLAEIYVRRAAWGKPVCRIGAVIAVCLFGYYLGVAAPKARATKAVKTELSTTLPAAFETLYAQIDGLTDVETLEARAAQIRKDGMTAVRAKDITQARLDKDALQRLADTLKLSYNLRIVSGANTTSGVWRIPDGNPNARNYYIIVQPVGADGKPISINVVNEENNASQTVSKFGVRVSKQTFDRIAQDKRDDGVIQNNVIGTKRRGVVDTQYTMPVLDGIITTW